MLRRPTLGRIASGERKRTLRRAITRRLKCGQAATARQDSTALRRGQARDRSLRPRRLRHRERRPEERLRPPGRNRARRALEEGPKSTSRRSALAHAAKTRNLRAGSIVGSGTISNKDTKRGYCCIAEKRCLEIIEHGAAQTEFMKFGDSVKIEMFDEAGKTIFGAIDQLVAPLNESIR